MHFNKSLTQASHLLGNVLHVYAVSAFYRDLGEARGKDLC